MDFLNTIQISSFAFLILLLIFIDIKKSSRKVLFDQKLFLSLILLTLTLLLIDLTRTLVNGKNTRYMRDINIIFSTLNYLLAPITSFIWTIYADYKINEDKKRIEKKLFILIIPIIINTIILHINLFTGKFQGAIFTITGDNIYMRGPYFYIIMAISYGYLLYTFINIVNNKDKLYIKDYHSLLSFIIAPLVGSALQMIFYGVKLTWISLTLSIFIIHMNIQNKQLYIDVLTGLYNRRKLNIYLDDVIKGNKGNVIGGIMIDLDDFKSINDTFGHKEGDKALVHVADLLKSNFRREDFIARYGGDEFLIVLSVKEIDEIKAIVKRLKYNINDFNDKNVTPYKIKLSIGYDIFYSNSCITCEDFINRIDNLMYQQKRLKHSTC